jgi:hypothetical protein
MDKSLIGIAIIGIAAFMFIGSKRSSSILENKFDQAVAIEEGKPKLQNRIDSLNTKITNFKIPVFPRFKVGQTQIIANANAARNNLVQERDSLVSTRNSLNVNEVLEL